VHGSNCTRSNRHSACGACFEYAPGCEESLSYHRCARRTFGRRSWRECQRHPHGGAGNAVLSREVLVTLYVEVALISLPCWKNEADLRADAKRASFEIAKLGARATVSRELLVK
jgi:hypothetical protein